MGSGVPSADYVDALWMDRVIQKGVIAGVGTLQQSGPGDGDVAESGGPQLSSAEVAHGGGSANANAGRLVVSQAALEEWIRRRSHR